MKYRLDEASRDLKRLLANGPLTALPKRPADQALLVTLAASRFEAHRTYRETGVNEALKAWLETFCEPFGIDHVTLRRMLVDARLMLRATDGSTYEINAARLDEIQATKTLDPVHVLDGIRSDRESRKRRHAA